MRRMPDLPKRLWLVACLALAVPAVPQEKAKSNCKPRISHSGFAEFVMPREGGTHKLAINAGTSVRWNVRNDNFIDWITILEGESGTGPGAMTVQLEPNPGRFCRVAELTISGIVPTYGLPIRILQEGGGSTVREEKPKEEYSSVIDLAPFAGGKPSLKRQYKPTTKQPR